MDLVKRVVQLQEKKWDKLGGSKLTQPTAKSGATTSSLNMDAPAFVPSREIEFDCQQPVRNAGEQLSTIQWCVSVFYCRVHCSEEWKEYLVDEDIDFVEQPE